MLEARHIAVMLGGVPAVSGVSLALSPGEVVALVGPNGAGKSTLLRAMAGTAPLAAGTVTLDGIPLSAWPRRALARRRAVLAQNCTLAFPFRVHEVVRLGRSAAAGHAGRAQDEAAVVAAMQAADVIDLAERRATALSGGERQRVHLARALAQIWPDPSPHDDPRSALVRAESVQDGSACAPDGARYLLLDEPTASLDFAHQHHGLNVARRLARAGAGVLAVLHDLNLAALYADRVCLMEAGRIVALGAPAEALDAEILTAVFGHPVVAVARLGEGRPALLTLPKHS